MFLLKTEQRSKLDESDDAAFYCYPRFVYHVDNGFVRKLKQLYSQKLQSDSRILDLMSSWVSHLPETIQFSHVEGHGMNQEELAKNPRLDHYFIQNLNQQTSLPLEDQSFDAVLITASIQYIQYPEAIFREIARVLKPNGIAIISFSNRMFYQKAISIWRDSSEKARLEIVKSYFKAIEGFGEPEIIAKTFILGGDPFYVVMANRL
ncbi:MAG: class I SAM-dependent methyltransferase [Cyanobacteriota bacterium ELA615]